MIGVELFGVSILILRRFLHPCVVQLPLVDGENDEKILKFFWLDAQQGEARTSDTVFLFGKVYSAEAEDYVSCCVSVKNVERNLFVLPR